MAKMMEPEEYEEFCKKKSLDDDIPVAEAPTPKLSLYVCNQMVMAQKPDMTKEEILSTKSLLEQWFEDNPDEYFMLLNNELHYYTVFHQVTATFGSYAKMVNELLDVLIDDIKNIKTIEVDTNGALAIWSGGWEDEGVPHCFYFFPYGRGVIEV